MLYNLPPEVTLNVLSHLPIPSLLSLRLLSHQWSDFVTAHQYVIFHGAALYHRYIPPRTGLEDVLSVNMGRPLARTTSWKDICRRSIQARRNWMGKGRAVARVFLPVYFHAHRIKVDEKAGICITTHRFGGLTVTHLFSGTVLWHLPSVRECFFNTSLGAPLGAQIGVLQSYVDSNSHCEYDNGYLVFGRKVSELNRLEVWRLASDFVAEGEVAVDAPPSAQQMAESAHVTELYRHYAPRGQFRPWSLLTFDEPVYTYRLAYPTLIFASREHAFLYDVGTGCLLQTISIHPSTFCSLDVNERHVFVNEPYAVRVFSRESGIEVLRIPAEATIRCSQRVEDPFCISGGWFITPLSVSPKVDESPRPEFRTARVSRDGRDLVIISEQHRIVFIRDFERICRGETTFEQAGLVLGIEEKFKCYGLGFEDGRVCVATIQGLYIFTFRPDLLAKAAFVRPSKRSDTTLPRGCIQLTDHRIYFTWEDSSRRENIPLFEDAENVQELSPPITPIFDVDFEALVRLGQQIRGFSRLGNSVGYIDFTLMPEEIRI